MFSLLQYILSNQVEEGEDTYPGLNPFMRMLL